MASAASRSASVSGGWSANGVSVPSQRATGELAHLQVNIARAPFHGASKDRIQIHALHIGSAIRCL
jgi:hypothetical protein